METYIHKVRYILNTNNICESHGINHALAILKHAEEAIKYEEDLSDNIIKLIKLASLCHDIDDHKFFPNNKNYENLRNVCDDLSSDDMNIVITMVDYVSASKYGDIIPDMAIDKPYLLIPRYCDRLEAIGIIGIERCYKYTKKINNPLYTVLTDKTTSEDYLFNNIATKERYLKYDGKSISMIDHFYDKLIQLGYFDTSNPYLFTQSRIRTLPVIKFVLMFGEHGHIDDKMVENFIEQNKY